jgi:hypothetical protein
MHDRGHVPQSSNRNPLHMLSPAITKGGLSRTFRGLARVFGETSDWNNTCTECISQVQFDVDWLPSLGAKKQMEKNAR